jgi:hypothetical protein
MALNQALLREAKQARDRLLGLQHEAELAQVSYQHTIRRLHGAGGSLREIADALGLSYQRVHQIVDVATGKGAVKECRTNAVCSFCGADKNVTQRLIAGPGVLVCEQCVVLAQDLLGEGGERERATRPDSWTSVRLIARLVAASAARSAGRSPAWSRRRIGRRPVSSPGPRTHRASAPMLCDEILSEALGV